MSIHEQEMKSVVEARKEMIMLGLEWDWNPIVRAKRIAEKLYAIEVETKMNLLEIQNDL